MSAVPRSRSAHLRACGWFWAWALVGGAAALALVSLGVLLLVPVVLAVALLASRSEARRSAAGLVTGAGVLALVVAWLQRAGPGTTCWHTATASGCEEHLDPLPWLVAGAVLVLAGIAVELRRRT